MGHQPGEMLKRWREQKGMNQGELAAKLRVDNSVLSGVERGLKPSMKLARAVERVTKGGISMEAWRD
jgi:ribosome-binding protein aMBF1 (putative translation factor)